MTGERKANITVLTWAARSRPKTSQETPRKRSGKTNWSARMSPIETPARIHTDPDRMNAALAALSRIRMPAPSSTVR